MYYVSWSPKSGECTFTRCFNSKEERDRFLNLIGPQKHISTWENF